MNNYVIRVLVDPTGALRGLNAIARALDGIEGRVGRAGDALSTIFGLHYVKRGVQELLHFSDAYTDVQTKIQMASKKTDVLTVSMDKVFSAANRSRTGVEAFSQTVLAIAGATQNMNLKFDDSVRMTETLSKMMRLGGATTQEAKSTITQYGQAMRKGKLDSDEFRSVMENSLPVQKALAKELGISTDELARYSKQGKITRQVMVDALINSAAEVDRQFAQTSMRVADGWTVIHNAAVKFAGDLNLGALVTPILLFIADNFDVLAKAAMVVSSVISTYFVQRGINLAISAMGTLGRAMLANPFMALIAGLVAVTTAIYLFARDLKVAEDSLATIGDFASVVLHDLVSLAQDIGRWFKATLLEVATYFEELTGVADLSFRDIMMFFGIMADSLIAVGKFIKNTLIYTFKEMALAIGEIFIDIANKARKLVTEIVYGKSPDGLMGDVTPGLADLKDMDAFRKRVDEDRKRVDELKAVVNKTKEVMKMTPAEYAAWQQQAVPNMTKQQAFDKMTIDPFTRGMAAMDGVNYVDPAEQQARIDRARKSQADFVAEGQRAAAEIATIEMKYGKVTYSNPLRGAGDKALDTMHKYADELEKDLFENKGPVQEYLEKAFAKADAIAAARKPKMGMGDSGGKAGEPPEDKEATRKREQALKQYEALESSISVVYKAELELANAQEILNKAEDYGFVSHQRAVEIVKRKRTLLQDQLDPYNALIGKMQTEILATQDLSRGWSDVAAVKQKVNDLYKQGIDLTNKEIFQMERLMALQKGLSDDQKRKTDLLDKAHIISPEEQRARALADAYQASQRGPSNFKAAADRIDNTSFLPTLETAADRYARDVQRITQLGGDWIAQGVSQNEVLRMQAELLRVLNEEYGLLAVNQRSITDGLKQGWNQTFKEFGNTAQQVTDLTKTLFNDLKNVIVDFVMQVDIKWQELGLSILRVLADIATQQLIYGLMNLVGGAIGGGPNITPVIQATQHADGGVFKVNGPPGRDAVFTPMMLTRGEIVEITPRGETPRGDRQQVAGGGVNVIVVRNDTQANLAVMQSPVGKRTQMANIAENETYLRTLQARS